MSGDADTAALAEAERWLVGLELFGMRFGLDRMRRLLTALGSPQERLDAVHVVGTNGKSSTSRMLAALLRAHGLRTGTYLSPHLVSFTERVRVDDRDVAPERFAAAVARTRRAAEKVDRTLEPGDRVTQFEALTAAAFTVLADAGAGAAVVEAGLGGRWDATNVLDRSRVQVLTNIGLEHTRWLGPTVADIAAEKLAVVRPGATLVLGAGPHPDALAVAERECAAKGARLVVAPAEPPVAPAARGGFQRRNFALACAAAEAHLGRPLDAAAVAEAAATVVPGRFEVVAGRPETILDGAHNAEGMAALADALGDRRVVACLSVLDDKDATGMLRALLPSCEALVCCACSNPRALPPATLASLAGQVAAAQRREGLRAEVVAEPAAALARARALAGPDGTALATGSLYLLADLRRPAGALRSTL